MRRALIVLGVLGLSLLAAAPASAGDVGFFITLPKSHGLTAKLETNDDQIELEVHGKQAANFYLLDRGEVGRKGIDLRFGNLGRFAARFEPETTTWEGEIPPGCRGKPAYNQRGWFVGELRFRGEHDFYRFGARRLEGKIEVDADLVCPRRPAVAARSAKNLDEATLLAISPDRSRRLAVFGVGDAPEEVGPTGGVIASEIERRDGMRIGRVLGVPFRRGFDFDHRAGTALVEPPAPFNGRARFVRHRGGTNTWRGSLSLPLLGVGRVHLAGPGYTATMKADLPNFE